MDTPRSRRQSRVSREIVSSNPGLSGLRPDSNLSKLKPWLGHSLSVVPTKEWQDNLSKLLGIGRAAGGLSTSSSADRPVTQRRRMNEEKSLTTLQTLEATGK